MKQQGFQRDNYIIFNISISTFSENVSVHRSELTAILIQFLVDNTIISKYISME